MASSGGDCEEPLCTHLATTHTPHPQPAHDDGGSSTHDAVLRAKAATDASSFAQMVPSKLAANPDPPLQVGTAFA